MTDAQQLEKFALYKYRQVLSQLDIRTDYYKTDLTFNNKVYHIRLEGDDVGKGKYKWKVVMSYGI